MTTTCEPPSTLQRSGEVDAIISDWLSFGGRSGWFNGRASGGSRQAHSQCQECALHCRSTAANSGYSFLDTGIGGCKVWCCTPCRNWMEQSTSSSAAWWERHLSNSGTAPDWAAETLPCGKLLQPTTPNCLALASPWYWRYRNCC